MVQGRVIMQGKRKKIITIITVIMAIICTAIILLNLPKKQPEITHQKQEKSRTEGVDRDTGEDLNSACLDSLCSVDSSRHYTTKVFGAANLAEQLFLRISERQYTGDGPSALNHDIISGIAVYGDTIINKTYPSLTIIPSTLSFDEESSVSGKIRYGQSDSIVPFKVKILTGSNSTRRGYLTINDSFYYLGGFTNIDPITKDAEQYIRQSSYSSNNLIISTTDKEYAIQHIASLGYKIIDLNITFTNYRSPFDDQED
jgi:hypothetical protein